MSLKDKKKNLIQKLKAKNYAVENETVDSITFLSGRTYFLLQLYEGANDYYRLVLPNFYQIENLSEDKIFKAINEVNKTYRLVKVIYVNNSLWISIEVFFETEKMFLDKLDYLLGLSKTSALKVSEIITQEV